MNWELDFRRCLEKRWPVWMPEARYLVDKKKTLITAPTFSESGARHALNSARDFLAQAQELLPRPGIEEGAFGTEIP